MFLGKCTICQDLKRYLHVITPRVEVADTIKTESLFYTTVRSGDNENETLIAVYICIYIYMV